MKSKHAAITVELTDIINQQAAKFPPHMGLIAVSFSAETDELAYITTVDLQQTEEFLQRALEHVQRKAIDNPKYLVA